MTDALKPVMPKATAVWLVENTALTFRQISQYCGIHELEIQAIADGDIAANIVGRDPVRNGLLTWDEIRRCEADSSADLVPNTLENNVRVLNANTKKMLSPMQRSEKPAAILWIIKNCPEIIDSQICKLVGTTKPTIARIRNEEYDPELKPKNPVTIGLCTESDLEKAQEISKARTQPKAAKKKKAKKKAVKAKAVKTAKKTVKTAAKKTAAKAKKAPAKKAAAKKAPVKKIAAKKAPVKKTAAKKAVKKAAPKTKAAAKTAKAPAKKVSAAKKPAAKKAATKAVKKPAVEKESVKKTVKTAVRKAKAAPKAKSAAKTAKKPAAKKAAAKTKKASAKK